MSFNVGLYTVWGAVVKFGSASWYLEANHDSCRVTNLSAEIIVIPVGLDMYDPGIMRLERMI